MKKYIYCVGIHKDGGLNILSKFEKLDKNENIYLLDKDFQENFKKILR